MGLKLDENWAEVIAVFFLVLGFVISALLHNAIISFLSVVIAGFLAGRIYYLKRFAEPTLPLILIILGFFIGYLLGSFWASRLWVIIFFVVSFGLSYYLHLKGIFVTFKSEKFIK